MLNKKEAKKAIKALIRSRSFAFVRHYLFTKRTEGELAVFKWKGKDIYYRPGTSDAEVIYKILLYPES